MCNIILNIWYNYNPTVCVHVCVCVFVPTRLVWTGSYKLIILMDLFHWAAKMVDLQGKSKSIACKACFRKRSTFLTLK